MGVQPQHFCVILQDTVQKQGEAQPNLHIALKCQSYNHTLLTNGNLRVCFQTIYWLARKINSYICSLHSGA